MTWIPKCWRLPGAVCVGAALLAGCGGGGGSSSTPPNSDTQAPSVTLTAPADLAAGITGTLVVSASATDDSGTSAIVAIDLQIDGQAIGSGAGGGSQSVSIDTTQYASGQHIVRARARDQSGNQSAWVSATVQFGGTRSAPAGITRSTVVSGLGNATAIAAAPDGRLFVAQQSGVLRVIKAGALLTTPFMSRTVDSTGERGLIGITLHPDFANNGWVYLYHTTPENGAHNRIIRLAANPSSPDIESVGSELRIADLPALSTATNHNGGGMKFGSDGKLYVGVGDNANSARAPDTTSVFGKVLRFNDDGSIPSDNPFCTTAGTQRCAVWAYGLRNPFTLAVQPSTGRLHVNDVGESTWEEINLGAAGANYGWPASEGPTTSSGVTSPLFAYRHTAANPAGSGSGGFFTGCAISGGAFYPSSGPLPAAYRGGYFFADYCSGVIGRLDLANGNAAYAFGAVPPNPVDMTVGADGALYVLTRDALYRFASP